MLVPSPDQDKVTLSLSEEFAVKYKNCSVSRLYKICVENVWEALYVNVTSVSCKFDIGYVATVKPGVKIHAVKSGVKGISDDVDPYFTIDKDWLLSKSAWL